MARSVAPAIAAHCPTAAAVSPPRSPSSPFGKRRVSFHEQPISSVQFTHAATDYDRRSIVIDPITQKDLAALYVFKMSLSMQHCEQKHQLMQLPAPQQQTHSAKVAAAADSASVFSDKESTKGSDEDWIENIAQSARSNVNNGQLSDFLVSGFDKSIWDTVDTCCLQIMRF
ncbi:hypothetical protein HDU83_007931 [Entophlyctis luteolus]|nr:hypothetical protein HDU83_007931 [Entophlyctis luteolus]